MADLRLQRRKPGVLRKILYSLAGIVLFKSIKKSMGLSNARICCSTGSVLSPDAFRFYHALGLPLKTVYGTTESGPLAAAANDDISLGSVGPVGKHAQVRVAENGELVFRSPAVFAGYYKDQERTKEVFKDGWFYSGDSGCINEDGHIVFQDRIGELIDFAGGDKLSPQLLEARLRASPYIKDAWIFAGPKKAYASAIIVINYDKVGRWAGQRRVAFSTYAELSQKPEVYELIKCDIDRVNSDLPPASRIKKYVNLCKEFDPDENELTRTRKLRKRFLEEHYRDLIEAIYSDKAEVPIETRVGYRDGRTGAIKTTLSIKTIEGAA